MDASASAPSSPPPPRWLVWLHRRAGRRGFLPLAGLATSLDAFLPVVPAVSMLVASVLLRPRQWRRAVGWFALGGAIGAFAFAALVAGAGRPMLAQLPGDEIRADRWLFWTSLVQRHGVLFLFVVALGPWPVRTVVAACALGGMPLWQIGAAVLGARLAGFAVLAVIVARVPAWLVRFRPFRRIVKLHEAAAARASQSTISR